ncbi:MAG: acyl-CoA thioesterase, partial [Deltaproteobacteria bacterium]|nr:acyl-CoA thioesterase [Deltaproteobacteria bacterium]
KSCQESQVEATYLVLPPDANSLGTIFGGRVMEWIDKVATIVAMRHTQKTCVTVSMDELHFISPVRIGHVVNLKASLNYVHKTSLEIGVKVEAENPLTGQHCHTASAYLTFVCLDEKGKPTAVPPVLPETAIEKRRFKEAEERRKHRLKIREERRHARS